MFYTHWTCSAEHINSSARSSYCPHVRQRSRSHLAAMKCGLDTEKSCIISEIPEDINDSDTFKRTVNQGPCKVQMLPYQIHSK